MLSVASKGRNSLPLWLCKRKIPCSSQIYQREKSGLADKDLLGETIIPTYHFQASLPRLPIPKLEKTCERYLASQEVLHSSEDYSKIKDIVDAFQNGQGNELNQELIARDKKNKHTSYIAEYWYDLYLSDRQPILLNYNPCIGFNDDPVKEYNSQLIKATNWVTSSLKFMKTLQQGCMEPEVYHLNPDVSDNLKFRKFTSMLPEVLSWYGAYWYKAFPLDMSQFKNLFNSTRIPRKGKDEIYSDPNAKHMLVIRNGHFYVFDVFNQDGSIISPTEILAHLTYIANDNKPMHEYSLGAMTGYERNFWDDCRDKMIADGNTKQLRMIDSAAFALVLEDQETHGDPVQGTRMLLHGDPRNRWFDKSFQLIIGKDGFTGLNFEHAWGDGVAVMRYINDTHKDTITNHYVHPDTTPATVDSSQAVERLEFKFSPEVKDMIKKATNETKKAVDTLGMSHSVFDKCGKKFFKTKKVSPDAVMQLAFQMAIFRQQNATVPTYESCSTSAFKHGRTETIRPMTKATKKACEMFSLKDQPSNGELRAAIDACSKLHGDLTKNAAMGQGFDRHMFAMRKIAEESGMNVDIFQHESYAYINKIILSTSTLMSPAVYNGGFAPVVPNGYGVGYAMDEERCGALVTSYPANGTNSEEFCEILNTCLREIYGVLNKS